MSPLANPPDSMQRSCRLCGKPVSIRRQMSLFCNPRCEALHASLKSEPTLPRPLHRAPSKKGAMQNPPGETRNP